MDAERLQLTEPEVQLAQASDALAELGRTLSPVAVETFAPLEEALHDWRPAPSAIWDRDFRHSCVARMHVSTAKPRATRSTERSSLTLPPTCASASTSVRSHSRSSGGCRLHWTDCMDS